MVKILAVSDEESDRLSAAQARRIAPDLVLAAGDLPWSYLEFIASCVDAPLVFVPGNHDPQVMPTIESRCGLHLQAGMPVNAPRPHGCLNADCQVLDVAGRIVERLGYAAVTVSHAEEAVARYRAEPDGFDCVLLDLSMPQMDGLELSRIMRSINPAVRVVLCSGYSEQYATERFANQGLAGFLPKPYRIDELRRTLISAIG